MSFVLCFSSCSLFSKKSESEAETNTETEKVEQECKHVFLTSAGKEPTCTESGFSNGYVDGFARSGEFNPGEPRPNAALGIVPVTTIELYN